MLVMGKNAVRELLKGTRKIFNVYAQEGEFYSKKKKRGRNLAFKY